jgi:hypothetical protein
MSGERDHRVAVSLPLLLLLPVLLPLLLPPLLLVPLVVQHQRMNLLHAA